MISRSSLRAASLACAALLVGSGVSAVTLAAPASAAPTATVMVKTQRMKDANLNSGQVGWYEKGVRLTLQCSKRGQAVKGYFSPHIPNGGWDNLWYKVSDNYFVADVDIETGSNNPIAPDCGAPAPQQQPQQPQPAPASGRTKGATRATNPYTGNLVGWCTYGAQELVKRNAGYYISAFTGNANTWDDVARKPGSGWKVVDDAEPRSLVVLEGNVAGDPRGHVAWVDNVTVRNGKRYIDVTEMNYAGQFNKFTSRKGVLDVPGMSYILIP